MNSLKTIIEYLKKERDKFAYRKSIKPSKLSGHLNVHALDGDHLGQFAADLLSVDGGEGRGLKRVIFDFIETKPTI